MLCYYALGAFRIIRNDLKKNVHCYKDNVVVKICGSFFAKNVEMWNFLK